MDTRAIRQRMNRAWDTLAEGWNHLAQRASQALTRFYPVRHRDEAGVETARERHEHAGAAWGLLAAEVSDTADNVVVELEAPGMEADDFDLHVVDDTLVVRGEKRVESERDEGRFHVMERAFGAFERAIPLPAPVEEDGAKAQYRKGVLRVTLPKSRTARRRRIAVES
ncbi:Hsp20/alpha crystallin family protein [Thiohalospira sp.]|uniref:Hsp20/alpha crystallin family protein n=1 Tax=Thiohalospira sp. TaxID=3080549 RepID=UPI003980BB61